MDKWLRISTAIASSLLVTTLTLSGCADTKPDKGSNIAAQVQVKDSAKFKAFSEQFVEGFWQLYPGHAVYVGYYKYDNQLPIPNTQRHEKEQAFLNQQLSLLQKFEPAKLNANDASDYYILKIK